MCNHPAVGLNPSLTFSVYIGFFSSLSVSRYAASVVCAFESARTLRAVAMPFRLWLLTTPVRSVWSFVGSARLSSRMLTPT